MSNWNDYDYVLKEVTKNGSTIYKASELLKDNENIVLAAIEENGASLEYVSESLKNNKNIVLKAIKTCPFALYYASENLKNDKCFILETIKNNYYVDLHNISKQLMYDDDIIKEYFLNNCKFPNYLYDNNQETLKYKTYFLDKYHEELDNYECYDRNNPKSFDTNKCIAKLFKLHRKLNCELQLIQKKYELCIQDTFYFQKQDNLLPDFIAPLAQKNNYLIKGNIHNLLKILCVILIIIYFVIMNTKKPYIYIL